MKMMIAKKKPMILFREQAIVMRRITQFANGYARMTILGLLLVFGLHNQAQALTLANMITMALERSEELASARANLEAAQQRAQVAQADWYPDLGLTAHYGSQDNHGAEGFVDTGEVKLRMAQLLWDGGVTQARVAQSHLDVQQSRLELQRIEQQVLLAAATAYVQLVSTYRTLGYAKQSEQNIQRQTGLEEIRVRGGMGLTTDMLQAQSQLAGAQSRRLLMEEAYVRAQNRFVEIFDFLPEDINALDYPDELDLLSAVPDSLEQVQARVRENNLQLRLLELNELRTQKDVQQAQGGALRPRLDFILERTHKQNPGGIKQDNVDETLLKLELTMGFDLGFSGRNAVAAARQDLRSRMEMNQNQRRAIERQVRDAWIQQVTARSRTLALQEQSEITAAFLELARRERELGNRSLIDVLSGETALINAESDLEAARADALVAALNLLEIFAELNVNLLR